MAMSCTFLIHGYVEVIIIFCGWPWHRKSVLMVFLTPEDQTQFEFLLRVVAVSPVCHVRKHEIMEGSTGQSATASAVAKVVATAVAYY
jgi:hypothetical protein